jgi:hypothetical protein
MKSQQKKTPAKKPKQQASNMSDTITITGASDVIDISDTIGTSAWIGSGNGYNSITGSVTVSNGGYTIGTGSTTVPYTYTTTGTSFYQSDPSVQINADGMQIKEGGDIKIGGKSLSEAIAKIEDRLAILHPNQELENKWESLKELRRQYEALEKDILEKEKIMKILKEK